MKKFVSGLLIGIILTFSLTAFAAVKLKIVSNPYPVMVDGQKIEVAGYIINDSTFIKLADFKKVGLDSTFNKEKKQIEITSIQPSQAKQDVEQPPKPNTDTQAWQDIPVKTVTFTK